LRWPAMLRRLVSSLGLESALAGIVAIERTGGELAADPAHAVRHLVQACDAARERHRPDAIVLGGAALTAFAPAVAGALALPLLDSVETAVHAAWRSAARRAAERGALDTPHARADTAVWSGLSPSLQSLLSRAPTPTGG
jgi:Asp/Glu/hydantoin racemase